MTNPDTITADEIREMITDPNILPATADALEALLIQAVKHDQALLTPHPDYEI